jgi:ketosteroid isomerase-like protein
MSEHPNTTLIRDALDALAAREVDTLAGYLADDVAWHYIGGAEPIRGRDAVLGMFEPGSRDFEIRTEIHDVVANDEHGVALVNATATRGGRTLAYRTAEILHLRDGKITERWAFSDDTATITAFFA